MKLPPMRLSTATTRARDAELIRCVEFLRAAGSIPAAQAMARKHNFRVNTSVWIKALGRMLK